ncbi:helix-turn-helix domain-containing protein [Roseomonas sp. HJA6]|uniref:Helix-turn-helix domain-containing protein n=1 Tax=Roseomonas alba TaxID=2846776 RepID=A0ABS7ACC6_9PROT|nr:helix-turn-helix transcriptional regulator [Neoroseomonas alba]MBW6399956.1 helix-turn-helix domain-containing protein [Neoroseomonas alba]
MPKRPNDWHPEDIKAAVRKTGSTLSALSRAAGLSVGAAKRALDVPWPRAEAIIAARLGVRPQDIWPSRYDAEGLPLKGRPVAIGPERSRSAPTPHRQKSEAA